MLPSGQSMQPILHNAPRSSPSRHLVPRRPSPLGQEYGRGREYARAYASVRFLFIVFPSLPPSLPLPLFPPSLPSLSIALSLSLSRSLSVSLSLSPSLPPSPMRNCTLLRSPALGASEAKKQTTVDARDAAAVGPTILVDMRQDFRIHLRTGHWPQHQEHHWASVSSPCPVRNWIGKSCRASMSNAGPVAPASGASLGLCFFPMPVSQLDRKVLPCVHEQCGPCRPSIRSIIGPLFLPHARFATGSESLAVRP